MAAAKIIAIILAALLGGGGVGALLKARPQNRALDSKTLTKVTEAVQIVYERITQDLRAEIDRVVEREKQCRIELDELRGHVRELQRQLVGVTVRLDQSDEP